MTWRSGVSGAGLVAVGAALSGLSAYAFLVLTARHLGPRRDASLSALWSLAFLAGPGLFLPFEQEVARLVSVRAGLRVGSRDVIVKAVVIGSAVAGVLGTVAIFAAGPITRHLFDDQPLLLVGFLLTLPGYLCMHLTWGHLAGHKRLGAYAVVTAAEGGARLLIGLALLLAGVTSPGPFGLALGVAPFVAAACGLWRHDRSLAPTPNRVIETWALSSALLALGVGSLLNQFLIMAGPIAIKLLAKTHDPTTARFLAAMVLVRVPLFLFNAVLAALLPSLATLAAARRHADFRAVLRKVTVGVVTLGIVLVVASGTIAPDALAALFGSSYRLQGTDLALLAGACAVYMLALTFSQGLIARSGHLLTTVAWAVGVSVFVLIISFGRALGLRGRVEWGFLVGCLTAASAMGTFLARTLPPLTCAEPTARSGTPAATPIAVPESMERDADFMLRTDHAGGAL